MSIAPVSTAESGNPRSRRKERSAWTEGSSFLYASSSVFASPEARIVQTPRSDVIRARADPVTSSVRACRCAYSPRPR